MRELVYFRQPTLNEKDMTLSLNNIPDTHFKAKDAGRYSLIARPSTRRIY